MPLDLLGLALVAAGAYWLGRRDGRLAERLIFVAMFERAEAHLNQTWRQPRDP